MDAVEIGEGQNRREVWKKICRGVVWEVVNFKNTWRKTVGVIFRYIYFIFQLADMILKRYFNIQFYKYKLNFRYRKV